MYGYLAYQSGETCTYRCSFPQGEHISFKKKNKLCPESIFYENPLHSAAFYDNVGQSSENVLFEKVTCSLSCTATPLPAWAILLPELYWRLLPNLHCRQLPNLYWRLLPNLHWRLLPNLHYRQLPYFPFFTNPAMSVIFCRNAGVISGFALAYLCFPLISYLPLPTGAPVSWRPCNSGSASHHTVFSPAPFCTNEQGTARTYLPRIASLSLYNCCCHYHCQCTLCDVTEAICKYKSFPTLPCVNKVALRCGKKCQCFCKRLLRMGYVKGVVCYCAHPAQLSSCKMRKTSMKRRTKKRSSLRQK
ncbi:hypothetical protein POVWA2_020140 [Plasmodium ovale wallikeri]|uniref:Uncharacterized protein n=1 Tax=Plasmodium ovale wallikeri TaxID=864142 RepID=A0A1A8YR09_PLAOA|nr:hypothetical protein POVWA1_019950 [Plasmodium ovale wallikeri]SBT34525.1 hypothetical protein POVWA2_020140 [Plasmodium ovale wallikeri]